MKIHYFWASSLEKVFPDQCPARWEETPELTILQGETPALQLVYCRCEEIPGNRRPAIAIRCSGSPVPVRLRPVELIPGTFPAYDQADENYLTVKPGLFPDLLTDMPRRGLPVPLNQYRSVWVDIPGTDQLAPGEYSITFTIGTLDPSQPGTSPEQAEDPLAGELKLTLRVLPGRLPDQTLLHTEWFHADCLADYYHVPVFSEEHWNAIEQQIALAAQELRVNVLLTPVFTPPLDTAVGGERTTVQLVDVFFQNGKYFFGWEKLRRWCGLCRKYGIRMLEIAHLFTQWGALYTPKSIVRDGSGDVRKFGWHVRADSPEYREFLEAFLPALRRELAGMGYPDSQVLYHISDEPNDKQEESYRRAHDVVLDLLDGCVVIDALSDYSFYQKGLVEHPVPSNNHIQDFLDHSVPDLWVYYCCAQYKDVPNRFFAMPSARNRIMGLLCYLHGIKGFLHWGYNFYNSALSVEHIDPYFCTHGGCAFPSGDPFLVYPGPDGRPYSSIRAEVQRLGLDDMRALQLLEQLTSREHVLSLIYEEQDAPFTFEHYPHSPDYLLSLSRRVHQALAVSLP